ncbi:MAG: hypothetical protein MJ164_02855 [Alphaproteobacteria bacterium]|nr:hypothetical protein [Alphaproteobacteria bacterium]
MHKKHMFLRVFSKTTIFACVFCAFFVSPTFATLPSDFTELEYIETDGTAKIIINLANVLSSESDFEVKYYLPIEIANTSRAIFGAYYGNDRFSLFAYARNQGYDSLWTSGSSTYLNGNAPGWRTITLNGTTFSDGNITKNIKRGPEKTYSSFGVFSSQEPNFSSINGTRIAYLKIDNSISLIPAKRNSDNEIGMYDTVSQTFFTNQGTGYFIAGPIAHCKTFGTDGVTCTECETDYILNNGGGCSEQIKIATTKFVDEEFKAAEAKLATTVQTIESVVSRTISQTGPIQVLQDTKQTRPDENCPANMKCLLVQDEDGTPHWYPIIEP